MMSEEILIKPKFSDNNVVIEFSEDYLLTKNVKINVPSEYEAYFASNEAFVSKLENCKNKRLIDLVGKEFKNSEIKIAYVKRVKLPLEPWGFGQVRVKNDKYNVTYNVGMNGKYQLDIVQPMKLIKSFGKTNEITVSMLKEKTKPYLEPVARPLLAAYFTRNDISIFEIESHIDELRSQIVEAFTKQDVYRDLGLKIRSITVNGIYIPDEDMKMMRNMINDYGVSHYEDSQKEGPSDEEIERLNQEIKKIRKGLEALQEASQTDTVLDEIDNLRMELLEAIKTIKANQSQQDEIVDLQRRLDELKKRQ